MSDDDLRSDQSVPANNSSYRSFIVYHASAISDKRGMISNLVFHKHSGGRGPASGGHDWLRKARMASSNPFTYLGLIGAGLHQAIFGRVGHETDLGQESPAP